MDESELPAGEKRFYTLPPGEKGFVEAERVAARADHGIITKDVRQAVESGADEAVMVCGIARNEAKTGIYWSLSTYRDDREFSPNLSTLGPHGTGKSNLLDMLGRYCKMSSGVISAIDESFPVIRDRVLEEINPEERNSKTVIIEEADKCLKPKRLENFISSSYEGKTSKKGVKREQAVGWGEDRYDLEGVSFLTHRRRRLYDGANRRRNIPIRTEPKEGDFPLACDVASPHAHKAELVIEVLLPPLSKPQGIQGGIWNNYKMLIQIATCIGDTEWADYIKEKMKRDSALLVNDREYEPSHAIFNALITVLPPADDKGDYPSILLVTVADAAKRDYDMVNCKNQEVSQELQAVGIDVHKAHGPFKIFPTRETLLEAARKLGVDTDFLEP